MAEGCRLLAFVQGCAQHKPARSSHRLTALLLLLPPAPPFCSAYSQKKIQENVQCEIMHCIVEEATESYRRGRMCAGGAVTMCMACQARGTTCRRTLRLRSARRTTTTSPPLCPPCREEIVHVLQSSTPEDMEQNVEQLTQWARSWRPSS